MPIQETVGANPLDNPNTAGPQTSQVPSLLDLFLQAQQASGQTPPPFDAGAEAAKLGLAGSFLSPAQELDARFKQNPAGTLQNLQGMDPGRLASMYSGSSTAAMFNNGQFNPWPQAGGGGSSSYFNPPPYPMTPQAASVLNPAVVAQAQNGFLDPSAVGYGAPSQGQGSGFTYRGMELFNPSISGVGRQPSTETGMTAANMFPESRIGATNVPGPLRNLVGPSLVSSMLRGGGQPGGLAPWTIQYAPPMNSRYDPQFEPIWTGSALYDPWHRILGEVSGAMGTT